MITYLTAFGFYAVVYGFDVELLPAAFTVGMISMLALVPFLGLPKDAGASVSGHRGRGDAGEEPPVA